MWYQIQEKTESGYWKVAATGLDEIDVVKFVNANSSDMWYKITDIEEAKDWFYFEREQYRLIKFDNEKQVKNGF